jgi:hypothetical protein
VCGNVVAEEGSEVMGWEKDAGLSVSESCSEGLIEDSITPAKVWG